MTDYAIARRIMDLHCLLEESIDRTYSLEDIQRYITFARLFKPKVCLIVLSDAVQMSGRVHVRDLPPKF